MRWLLFLRIVVVSWSGARQVGVKMWKLLSVSLLLLAALGLPGQGSVQPDPEQDRILSLENAWNQAVQQKDAHALEMLLAPDLVYVEYDGTLMNKAEYLASVRSPSLHPVRIVNESTNVRLYGAVAVVNGVCRENGVKNGKPYTLHERFTDTWIRRGDNWMCVASESTLIPH
jgi:ketosteroid isomerase-like protein